MKKKVGITIDLVRKEQFWKSMHPSLDNWKEIKINLTYEQAQSIEREYEMLGYERGAGGPYISGYVWSVYTFEY